MSGYEPYDNIFRYGYPTIHILSVHAKALRQTHTHTSCADTSVAYYVRPDPELKVRLWRDEL